MRRHFTNRRGPHISRSNPTSNRRIGNRHLASRDWEKSCQVRSPQSTLRESNQYSSLTARDDVHITRNKKSPREPTVKAFGGQFHARAHVHNVPAVVVLHGTPLATRDVCADWNRVAMRRGQGSASAESRELRAIEHETQRRYRLLRFARARQRSLRLFATRCRGSRCTR